MLTRVLGAIVKLTELKKVRSPPDWIIGRAKRAPHGWYICDFNIYVYGTYVGVCVTPFFFSFGVHCAQYKVHAQCSFAALAPHMPCMLLVRILVWSDKCQSKQEVGQSSADIDQTL